MKRYTRLLVASSSSFLRATGPNPVWGEIPIMIEAVREFMGRRVIELRETGPGTVFLNSQVFMIPHPKKEYKGGEDAFFVSSDGRAVGVADGVGGWSDKGVDPAIYSKSLMAYSKSFYESKKNQDPLSILNFAWEQCKGILGSTTACLVLLDPLKPIMSSANIGDSGFLVIRDEKLLYKTEAQQARFNMPFQLGSNNRWTPKDANIHSLEIKEGDFIILATDGVFDNLYDEEIIELINKNMKKNKKLSIEETLKSVNLAEIVAKQAHVKAKDKSYLSPFAKHAKEHGLKHTGGKMDDITVIVSYVGPALFLPIKFANNGVLPPPSKL